MNIGSIVECVDDSFDQKAIELIANRPKRGKIYTVRGIKNYPKLQSTGILLEEITNDPILLSGFDGLFEPTFNIKRFRELPEMNIDELIEEIELKNE